MSTCDSVFVMLVKFIKPGAYQVEKGLLVK